MDLHQDIDVNIEVLQDPCEPHYNHYNPMLNHDAQWSYGGLLLVIPHDKNTSHKEGKTRY